MHCPYCGRWCVKQADGTHACKHCKWDDVNGRVEVLPLADEPITERVVPPELPKKFKKEK